MRPARTASIGLSATVVLSTLAVPAIAQVNRTTIPEFEELIEAGMREDAIPGLAVVVVDSGRVVWSRGFGVADVATNRPVDVDSTLFRIGSVTKPLTALGILRLVDQGALRLDTPVRDVAPLPVLRAHGEPVRVRHLLSHTGGFDQTGLGRHAPSAGQRPSLREFLLDHLVPIREPGVVATYDTYGMSLAGYVLERVSGEAYPRFMRAEVFEPVGMAQSFIEAPPEARDRLAVGYGLDGTRHVRQAYEWYSTLPASSADVTASDMGRLMIALLGDGANRAGRLLQPETAALLQQGAWVGTRQPFWHGWFAGRSHGTPILYHGGVMQGYSSQLVLVPERKAGLFVAYNRDPETGRPPRLRERLTEAFLDYVVAETWADRDEETLHYIEAPTDRLEGWWAGTLGCFTCRTGRGWPVRPERIESAGPGALRFRGRRWLAVDSLLFQDETTGASLRFARDAGGHIRYANAGADGFERLDTALVRRLAEWMEAEQEPEALQALLSRITTAASRSREMARLAALPPEVNPAGTFLLRPVGTEEVEPMRVEVQAVDRGFTGSFVPRPGRPARPISNIIVGGTEVWLVVEVPGGELDIRLLLDGNAVSGTVREELEEIRVTGRHIVPSP